MGAALKDDDPVALDKIDDPVLRINATTPFPLKVPMQLLRLALSIKLTKKKLFLI